VIAAGLPEKSFGCIETGIGVKRRPDVDVGHCKLCTVLTQVDRNRFAAVDGIVLIRSLLGSPVTDRP